MYPYISGHLTLPVSMLLNRFTNHPVSYLRILNPSKQHFQ